MRLMLFCDGSQVGWTTQLPWSAGTIEQRRFDALRLLRQVPAVTELSLLDASGKEQLRVSRLAMDVVGKFGSLKLVEADSSATEQDLPAESGIITARATKMRSVGTVSRPRGSVCPATLRTIEFP
jgi:hypothetical protein